MIYRPQHSFIMHFPYPTGGKPPPPPPSSSDRRVQIQGPRPSPLEVHKDSRKIKKPSLPQKPPLPIHREPVIIYAVSPKIIQTSISNFMTTVQRLTGLSTGDFSSSGGDVSPAARLAVTEKIILSPKEPEKSDEVMAMVDELLEMYKNPGILSPATLPPVPAGIFSPAAASNYNTHSSMVWNDWSPSRLLTSPMVSPVISPELFNLFFDF